MASPKNPNKKKAAPKEVDSDEEDITGPPEDDDDNEGDDADTDDEDTNNNEGRKGTIMAEEKEGTEMSALLAVTAQTANLTSSEVFTNGSLFKGGGVYVFFQGLQIATT